jgi:hypothetical protein
MVTRPVGSILTILITGMMVATVTGTEVTTVTNVGVLRNVHILECEFRIPR